MTITVQWSGTAVGSNRRLAYSRKQGRAFRNRKYGEFVTDLAWHIRLAAMGVHLSAPVHVSYYMDAPKLDIDALTKPIYDAIQTSGLIRDDADITKGIQERKNLRLWEKGAGPHCLTLLITGDRAK